ncbi:MAG: hypothetical protein A4E19_20560 [Nitrospira sp. SG-bin1]|nr:MAG: hypothetical protein A4E19_20560 [Nitrospira sp. SG-bin1]
MAMPILSDRIRTTLEQLGTECPLEEVVDLCPEVTWNQVFLAIDHLSRTGQVRVRLDTNRTYWVQTHHRETADCLPHAEVPTFNHKLSTS